MAFEHAGSELDGPGDMTDSLDFPAYIRGWTETLSEAVEKKQAPEKDVTSLSTTSETIQEASQVDRG